MYLPYSPLTTLALSSPFITSTPKLYTHTPSSFTPSHLHRHSKPFNPLLGETVSQEGGYCAIAEQVSHHPPVTALHVESDKWVFWEEYSADINFRLQV